jgi:magnesium chelatase family protein
MWARRLSTILPPLDPDEAVEVTKIHSASGIVTARGLVTEQIGRSASRRGAAFRGANLL